MKIFVKAKPLSKTESVEKIDDENFVVAVKEPPREGKANHAIIKALAGYFNVPKSNLSIVSGHTAKNKIISVDI